MSPRSSSAEPPKPMASSKRKGTRSVSTLTPSQLARKRANDREAQRAIRARTKEHIERLERELDDLRSTQSRDKMVQDLLRRNKALEDELRQLKESVGVSMTSSPYSAPTVYDEGCGAIPSPRMSPLPHGGGDYISEYSPAPQPYVSMPNCEAWASTIPSSVPSPSSSANNDDYGPTSAYIPTSVPSGIMSSGHNHLGLVHGKDVKMEYEHSHSHSHSHGMVSPHQQSSYMHHPSPHQRSQTWSTYSGVY